MVEINSANTSTTAVIATPPPPTVSASMSPRTLTHTSATVTTAPTPTSSSTSSPRTPASATQPSRSMSDALHDKLRTSVDSIYAAMPSLANRAEFFHGGLTGDVLVKKGTGQEELVLSGLYGISRNDFYFTPDGGFNPANVFKGKFHDTKLSCHLIAVYHQRDIFRFAKDDFAAIIDNLRSFEKMIPKNRGDETISATGTITGIESIKLTHSLFQKKPAADGDSSSTVENNSSLEDTPVNLGADFKMSSWPVDDRCQSDLELLIPTHDIQPLPAWDTQNTLIPPKDYGAKLRGATVEVHMALIHHHIKKDRRHVFSLVLREMIVRADPSPTPTSSFKRRRLDAGPVTESSR
ncbi:hypothetical protein BJ138DRAFT_1120845 [Hygrophoropsis aurantiaca]|uniref:Uncharacterized protein n=1 Tax=Hygrophoropsis aurantiaca TaxID=72124 RepID=A0ACB7ZQQ2_9AGAM|nr:hypothetical protein BJ138DRAFT_1120845 [Hygrophoropsis aurantiaca]